MTPSPRPSLSQHTRSPSSTSSMDVPDRTHIIDNEQAFDLEELIHVEETCVFFSKQPREEK